MLVVWKTPTANTYLPEAHKCIRLYQEFLAAWLLPMRSARSVELIETDSERNQMQPNKANFTQSWNWLVTIAKLLRKTVISSNESVVLSKIDYPIWQTGQSSSVGRS